jgi:formate dehydrogenase beta subunit
MPAHLHDMTPLVDLLHEEGTGPARTTRPVYRDYLPPCNDVCPAGENVQAWLALVQAGRYREAWLQLTADNPLPAVHGRVCYHPCESSCNRRELDTSVSIHAVERFLGDLAVREGWTYPVAAPTHKRVLVVGAGPCGLSAAYHLARLGHLVEICDAGPVAGGMLHFGIPAYRLPREDLASEIRRIESMGVKFTANHVVRDVLAEKRDGEFDAVLIAIGTQLDKRIDIPAQDASRVLTALGVLRGIEGSNPPQLGRRVVVYGGGNTAMDVARSARRLGADEPLIVYRRDREHMPAHDFELEEALAEGVKVKWLSTIRKIGAGEIVVEQMELDENGVPRPTGITERLQADAVVLALGQEADSHFLRTIPGIELRDDGAIVVDENLMTGYPGIFAGGDVLPGERTVTTAVGHGKKAARRIDAWLRGQAMTTSPRHPTVTRAMLNLPIYSDVQPKIEKERAIDERLGGFGEVVAGLQESEARYEAQRCLSCGNCFECDQCYAACPEDAIIKLGPGLRYEFDYTRCTGCRVCFEQCPCHAIEMIAETAI